MEVQIITQDQISIDLTRPFVEEYIRTPSLCNLPDTFVPKIFPDLLVKGHEFVSRAKLPRVHASIRDIVKAVQLLSWLQEQWFEVEVEFGARAYINPFLPEDTGFCSYPGGCVRQAFLRSNHTTCRTCERAQGYAGVMAAALAYWGRLPGAALAEAGRASRNLREEFLSSIPRTHSLSPDDIISKSVEHLWKHSRAPEGVAPTRSLQEAFYAVVVAVHTRIGLLLTGPPGCGKTLPFQLAAMQLLCAEAKSDIFRQLKRMNAEPYQGSESSTAAEIAALYHRAITWQTNASDQARITVAIDEAGLPKEQRQALKAAHDILDQRIVSSVYMSNTTLDAAKTSRMIQFLQAQTNSDDRRRLVRHLLFGVKANRSPERETFVDGICKAFVSLKDILPESGQNWFDTRNLVFFCRNLFRACEKDGKTCDSVSAEVFLEALRRNFQTRSTKQFELVAKKFMENVGLRLPAGDTWELKSLAALQNHLNDKVNHSEVSSAPFRFAMIIDPSDNRASLDILASIMPVDRRAKVSSSVCTSFQRSEHRLL